MIEGERYELEKISLDNLVYDWMVSWCIMWINNISINNLSGANVLINPICIIRSIYRSIKCKALVSGHDYQTIKEKTPPNIHIVKCMVCGKQNIGWSWGSLEDQK